jgi:hypothetical protein
MGAPPPIVREASHRAAVIVLGVFVVVLLLTSIAIAIAPVPNL